MDRRIVAAEEDTRVNGPGVAAFETAGILASIGEVAYRWDIATDELAWSANVGGVLAVDRAAIATGRRYAALLDRDNMQTRFDAVMHSLQRDDGRGVPYQIDSCMRSGSEAQG